MRPSASDIEKFLYSVDATFPVPLSQKQDLKDLAIKFWEKGTLCLAWENNEICSMVAGYTDNILNNKAYISVVATLDSARGQGYASRLIEEFIAIAEEKHIEAVHLYTDRKNIPAIRMYLKLGFEEWQISEEPRPDDMHLICFLAGKRG